MKFYVAGKLGEEGTVEFLLDVLRGSGHEITFDWTQTPHLRPFEKNVKAITTCAVAECRGVKEADIMIMFCHDKGVGMFVELGVALGNGIPVRVIMDHDKPARTGFLYHPLIKRVSSVDEVIDEFCN